MNEEHRLIDLDLLAKFLQNLRGTNNEQLNTAVSEHNADENAHSALFQGGKTVEKAAAYTLDNAVDYPLVDMRIYGKSTQDGEPSPENPFEIVSVENPTITVSNGTDSISAFLPYTLHGVPVEADGNYTDSNGQQWICDELIYNADGTGKIVKRTNSLALDGSDDENWALDTTVGDTMKKRLRFYTHPNIVPLNDSNKYNSKSPSRVICDKYDSATASETWNRTKKGISITHFDPHGYISVYDETYSESTLDEWKSYLASNPVTVVYPLNTPQEINLTAEEMTALKALQTFDGITNVSNDSGAEMCVKYCTNSALSEYVKPIKTGLQKQIDELKTAVLSLGGNV